MDRENHPHHQASLTDEFSTSTREQSVVQSQRSDLRTLVEHYITAKRTSGSPAYTASAGSVLRRWVAWMVDRDDGIEKLNDPQAGPRILNEYALYLAGRVQDQTLAMSTAERYFAYVSACLSFGVRQGVLDRNPALSDTASESLPQRQRSDRTDQQFWSQAQREAIVSFVNEEANSLDANSPDRWLNIRNKALVRILAYSGVRGAEILSHPKDDRDGRNGLRWRNVELDAGTILVFGKSQAWERTPIPSKCTDAISELKQTQAPATTDWPVFATGHPPSLFRTAREQLGPEYNHLLADVSGDIWELYRVHSLTPPALTTGGARQVMQRLTEKAGIEVEDGYLKLHGGRRGLGDLLYRIDRGHAQDILRHKDLATTQKAYQHIDAEERREQLDTYLEDASR